MNTQTYGEYGGPGNPAAILPTGEQMNPRNPEGAVYYDPEQYALVLRKTSEARTRPTRVLTGFGAPTEKVGDQITAKHDQTWARLGTYEVVGIHNYATGEMIGEVPDRKLPHSVFK